MKIINLISSIYNNKRTKNHSKNEKKKNLEFLCKSNYIYIV